MEQQQQKFNVGDLVRRIKSEEKKPLKVISASYIYYCGGQSWRYVLEDGFEAWEQNIEAYAEGTHVPTEPIAKKRGRKKKHRETN